MWSLLVWCGSPCPTTTTLGKTTPDQVMLSQDVAANVCTKSSSFSVASTAPSVLKTRGAQQTTASPINLLTNCDSELTGTRLQRPMLTDWSSPLAISS